MKRCLFFVLSLMLIGCERIEGDDVTLNGYVFHDDFFYHKGDFYHRGDTISKIYLTPLKTYYYIVFEEEYEEEVLGYLSDNGFSMRSSLQAISWNETGSDRFPNTLKPCMSLSIEGTGVVEQIPHILFSNCWYMTEWGLYGRSCVVSVPVPWGMGETAYSQILEYGAQLKIIPYRYYMDSIMFVCTNDSYGNPIEIVNWFYEVAGYVANLDMSDMVWPELISVPLE